jgi:hypothetical protein
VYHSKYERIHVTSQYDCKPVDSRRYQILIVNSDSELFEWSMPCSRHTLVSEDREPMNDSKPDPQCPPIFCAHHQLLFQFAPARAPASIASRPCGPASFQNQSKTPSHFNGQPLSIFPMHAGGIFSWLVILLTAVCASQDGDMAAVSHLQRFTTSGLGLLKTQTAGAVARFTITARQTVTMVHATSGASSIYRRALCQIAGLPPEPFYGIWICRRMTHSPDEC